MIILINKEGRLIEGELNKIKKLINDKKYEVEIIPTHWGESVSVKLMNRNELIDMIVRDNIEFFYLNDVGKIEKMTQNKEMKVSKVYYIKIC